MLKLVFTTIIFSTLLMSVSIIEDSFGYGDYDYLSEWGSFGINKEGQFSYPQFIAVSDDGTIYVTDLGNKRVQKLSSTGDYLSDWGQNGNDPGQFHFPSGIDVYGEFVYVADRDLNRIQKFTTDGEFILEWGSKGIREGQFLFPNGISVHNGIVYVVDTGNQRIQKFTTDGEFISSFGSSGIKPGQFLTIVGIDIDPDGNLFVTDKGNSKVEKFSLDGELIKSYPFYYSNYNFSPEAIAIDPTGKMFVVNSSNDRILHLSQNSDLKLSVFEQIGPITNSFDIVTDVAIGINGELLVVDSANHTVKSFETEFYVPTTLDIVPEILSETIVDLSSDKINPLLVVPDSIEIEATGMFTVVSYGNATATDENGIKVIINNAPEKFPPGITNITWVAFDKAGNVSSGSQTITVKTCGNYPSVYNMVTGTHGDDVLSGTHGDDLIFGLSGDDFILGETGDDCIFAGSGNDVVYGGFGNDVIKGNDGNDVLKGNDGRDILFGNSDEDILDGGDHFDECYYSDPSENNMMLNCER